MIVTKLSARSPFNATTEDASDAPLNGAVVPDDASEAPAESVSLEPVSEPEPTLVPEPASEAPEPQPDASESENE
ncbi:MAG: hypothetical protein AAFR31_05920 [Cyanobacteria bacterium J06627_8]